LRQQLRRYQQVAIVDGAEVSGLIADERRQRIVGAQIRYRRGERRGTQQALKADFVIDATGRNSRAPQWLSELGYPRPEETVINPFLGYVSRYYRRSEERSASWQMMYILPEPPDGTRSGLIFPQENDTWVVMMAGANKDYPPTDDAGFDTFARSVDPQYYKVLQTAEPITPMPFVASIPSTVRE